MSEGEEAPSTLAGRRAAYEPHETGRMLELAGTELASFASRAAAFVCDGLLAVLLFGAGVVATVPVWKRLVEPREHYDIHLSFHEWYGLLWLVLFFGLSAYWGNGRTLGKRLFRIRVVSLVHPRLTLWDALERALGYAASTAEVGFGFIQYFTHANRRTLHDRIAETIVVREPGRPPR